MSGHHQKRDQRRRDIVSSLAQMANPERTQALTTDISAVCTARGASQADATVAMCHLLAHGFDEATMRDKTEAAILLLREMVRDRAAAIASLRKSQPIADGN